MARLSTRRSRSSPRAAIAAASTLSLGLAMGANATIFGAIDALWLRPPGAHNPGELARVFSTSEDSREGLWSFPEYSDLRDSTKAEIGVRVALGAQRSAVLGLVLRDGLRLALAGLVIGIPAAMSVAGMRSSLLFGVGPFDRLAFSAAVLIVLGMVVAATLVPARRALRIMPSTALRNS